MIAFREARDCGPETGLQIRSMQSPVSPQQHPDDLLTIGEVAKISRRNPRTIRNRIYKDLPPQPVSAKRERLLFRRSDVMAWVLGRVQETAIDSQPEAKGGAA